MNFRRKQLPLETNLNVTPMVDVMLNLVIFFALTSGLTALPGIKVDLPQAQTGEIHRESKEALLLITSDGQVYLDHALVTPENLEAKLLEYKKTQPERTLAVIQADKRVAHGKVVEVMDAARRAGFRLAIGTAISEPTK